jgi:alkylation response protein AidB-like acyl-CoA dehydrogenase
MSRTAIKHRHEAMRTTMDLDLSDEQRELESSVHDVLEGLKSVEIARSVVEERDEAAKAVDNLWAQMVDLDWQSLTVPVENGGLGLGAVELAVVCEQMGRAVAPGPFLATSSQFVTAVREAGSDAQREEFLGAVTRDGAPGTLALTEAAGTFDTARVKTTFRPQGGDGFVLDGAKSFVMEPSRAAQILVVAREEGSAGDSGLGLFVVPAGAVGLEISPISTLDATRELANVALSSVSVGSECALGEPGDCGPVLQRILGESITALSAEMVGTCQGILDVLLAYAMTRKQFGVTIGSFQAMKHKLANMYVSVEATRATVRFAAAAIAEEDPRRTIAPSMAKSAAGDCEKLLGVEGIQSLGGIGYTWEHDMHLYVKRVRTAASLLGTGQQHRAKVAELIGL